MASEDLWRRHRSLAQRVSCPSRRFLLCQLTEGFDSANLNESYFANRQDRYIHFSHPTLATYCREFLQASSTFMYRLLPSPSDSEGYSTHWERTDTHPHHIEPMARATLSEFQSRWQQQSLNPAQHPGTHESANPSENALIMPIIQGGQFQIREEEDTLALLFNELSSYAAQSSSISKPYNGPLIDLTSGYFGLYNDYCNLILQSSLRYRIICSSPMVRSNHDVDFCS